MPSHLAEPVIATGTAALGFSASYIDLRLRMGAGVSLGNTCGAANEVTPSCAPSYASELNHRWVAPYDGTFTFSTRGSATLFDTVLQVTRWNDGVSIGCNDDSGGTPQSSVTVNLALNQEVAISVDGKGSACGHFQLDITGIPSTCGACNTPPGPCHEPNGTCYNSACIYALKAAGAACDDGNACTLGDTCSGSGACLGAPRTCDSPPDQCYASSGTCENGECRYTPLPAGSTCDDDDPCTVGDSCGGNGYCYAGSRACCALGETPCNGFCCPSGSYCTESGCHMCNTLGTSNPLRLPDCDLAPAPTPTP